MSIQNGQQIVATDFINNASKDATPANDAGRVAKLESDGKLHKWFLQTSRKYNVFEPMDGSSTPKAVTLDPSGSIIMADGNVTHRQSFIGFMKDNQSGMEPAVLGSATAGSTTSTSFTANAGNKRVILIFARAGDNSSNAVLPTNFQWNSLSFASIVSVTSNANCKMQIWALAIGDSGSNQTFNITCTAGSGANGWGFHAVCLDKTNQTTPSNGAGAYVNASGNGTGSFNVTQYYGKLIIGAYSRIGTANISAPSGVTDLIVGGSQELSWITHNNNNGGTITGGSGSSENAVAGIVLNGENVTQSEVEFAGIVSGFTGLTIGAKYYISDTAGAIQTTSGTANIPVGIAISATEILIKTAYPN